jgi:hypothetical protein
LVLFGRYKEGFPLEGRFSEMALQDELDEQQEIIDSDANFSQSGLARAGSAIALCRNGRDQGSPALR